MPKGTPSQAQVREIVRNVRDQAYVRGEAEADPEQELDALYARLVEAAQAYETGPKQQRQAVCDAIIAVKEFLEGQGFSCPTLMPLNRVVFAMTNLCKQNQPDPLFCEKRSKTKGKRKIEDSVRQGHLAALADAWIKSALADEGEEAAMLNRAARQISGNHFGPVKSVSLQSARAYQRQSHHPELLYDSYEQMKKILVVEAEAAGGGKIGLREAILTQLKGLNARSETQKS